MSALQVTPNTLCIGGKYNWKNQPDRLVYLGRKGLWHQFAKVYSPNEVWCEILSEDLYMIEETQNG